MALGLVAGADRQPEDPRPDVLPRGVLLPVAGLVGGDHHDRALHPQRRRPAEQALSIAGYTSHALVHHGQRPRSGRSSGLNAWTTSGTIMLFYLAALQSIPKTSTRRRRSTTRAAGARSGGSPSRCCGRPTSSSPWCSVSAALKLFDQAFIVSGGTGGPDYSTYTPVLYIYRRRSTNFEFGSAAAIGVILLPDHLRADDRAALLFGRGGRLLRRRARARPHAPTEELVAGTPAARSRRARDPRRGAAIARSSSTLLVADRAALLRAVPLDALDVVQDDPRQRRLRADPAPLDDGGLREASGRSTTSCATSGTAWCSPSWSRSRTSCSRGLGGYAFARLRFPRPRAALPARARRR